MNKQDTEFKPCRKFPEYEVSRAGTVRNRKYGNVIPHKIAFADLSRQRIVRIMRNCNPIDAFVEELVNDAWPELRMEAA